tara:strand:+ start:406 stop:591 length:186 start_codon:yes stop_codon:yes gene_type:complete
MKLDDVMVDLFNCDKSERRRILQETIYQVKWKNMRKVERQNIREKSMIHRGAPKTEVIEND